MTVIDNENVRPFDIDGTLILPYVNEPNILYKQLGRVVEVFDPIENKTIKMVAHEPMVRLLREEHHRGCYILVWSRSGKEWAANVIKALGLESCVHLVMNKPIVYFDDTPVADWLKDRVFLPADMQYKR